MKIFPIFQSLANITNNNLKLSSPVTFFILIEEQLNIEKVHSGINVT